MNPARQFSILCDNTPDFEAETCDPQIDWGMLMKFEEGNPPSYPVNVRIHCKSRRYDFLSIGRSFAINIKVIDAFNKHGITGWSTYPLIVNDGDKLLDEEFFGFTVKERVEHDSSRGVIWEEKPIGNFSMYGLKGLYFDLKNWNGADIFMVLHHIVCTKRTVTVLKNENITGWGIFSALKCNYHKEDVYF